MQKSKLLTVISIGLLLVVGIGSGPVWAARLLNNIAMLLVRDKLVEQPERLRSTAEITEPVHYASLPPEQLQRPWLLLQQAQSLAPTSQQIHWNRLRLLFNMDEPPAIYTATMVLEHLRPNNPLQMQHAVAVFARQPDDTASAELIAFYEAAPAVPPTRFTRDHVARAYLDVKGEAALDAAFALRPADLFVNYSLWQAAQQTGDESARQRHQAALDRIGPETLAPLDAGLLDYAGAVVPRLYQEGVWNQRRTLLVAQFLVWRYFEHPAVPQMLMQLAQDEPAMAEWPLLLAEVYHRRGQLAEAAAQYNTFQQHHPADRRGYLRLALLHEAQAQHPGLPAQETLTEALQWYAWYLEKAPTDVLGWLGYTRVRAALDCREDAARAGCPHITVPRHTAIVTNSALIAADVLGLPAPHMVMVGDNLVANANLETWQGWRPAGWSWLATFHNERYAPALYIGGAERTFALEGSHSAQIMGFWLRPEGGKSPAAGTFMYRDTIQRQSPGRVVLEPETPYMVSFWYATRQLPHKAAEVVLTKDTGTFWDNRLVLPPTDGAWQRVVLVGRHEQGNRVELSPIVQNRSTGTLSFDWFEVRPLTVPAAAEVALARPRLWLSSSGPQKVEEFWH